MLSRYPASLRVALFLPLLTLLATAAWGGECVLLQSSALKPYEEARQGFERAWQADHPSSGPKSIAGGNLTQILLSEQPEQEIFTLNKRLQAARLVVVIGDPALNAAKGLTTTPVIYLLAPSAGGLPHNFTGIDLRILPSQQIEAITRLLPKLRCLGALYNPTQTGQWVQEALTSPAGTDQTLLFRKIATTGEVPAALAGLRDKIDAYWLLPDDLVTNPQALAHLQEFSIANRVPILSFSDKYLKAGAAAAITFDIKDMGEQGAAMAARIFSGIPVGQIPAESPRRAKVIANTAVLHKMGATINETVVDEVYTGGAL
jgi:putative tryptophan/tyrosine transport system substrate-binding protein